MTFNNIFQYIYTVQDTDLEFFKIDMRWAKEFYEFCFKAVCFERFNPKIDFCVKKIL
jgi:hypothetical protein